MSSISWVGNRVLDPNGQRWQDSIPTQRGIDPTPTIPNQQDLTFPDMTQQGPPPSTEPGYIPFFLTENIGRYVRAEFIIGTNQYVDKTGVISEVGVNYFVLDDLNARTRIMCDLYSVKFVTLLPQNQA